MLDDGGKSGFEDGRHIGKEREEGGRGGMAEIVEMEAERWGREFRPVARGILLPVAGGAGILHRDPGNWGWEGSGGGHLEGCVQREEVL